METSSTLEQCKTFKHVEITSLLIMFRHWRRCSVQLNRNEGSIKKLNYIFWIVPLCTVSLESIALCKTDWMWFGKEIDHLLAAVCVCECVCLRAHMHVYVERFTKIFLLEVCYKTANSI